MSCEAGVLARGERSLRGVIGLASSALVLSACDGLLDVENPANLLDEDLDVPQLEETLSNSAEGDLAGPLTRAFRYGELISDAYWHPSITDYGLNIDRGYRDRYNVQMDEIYDDLAQATWIADDMVERLEALVADPGAHLGVARSYFWGAIARLTTASYYREITIDEQAPIAPAQAIEQAVERLQQAAQIAGAAGDANLEAGALGAAARAYRSLYYEPIALGQGPGDAAEFEQAEAAARQALAVAADFSVVMPFGTPGPINGMGARARGRMTPWYAFRIDPVSGGLDPRITHETPDTTSQGQVLVRDLKFPNTQADMPVSRAAEAELIIAEARFLAGDMAGAVEFINHVRSRSSLPPFTDVDPDAVWEQLMYERDTELWLEGRRWEDNRYYGIIPACDPDDPAGRYYLETRTSCGGATLWEDVNREEGTAKRWPISTRERANNPNYGGD